MSFGLGLELLAAGGPGFYSGIVLSGVLLCAGLSIGLWCAHHTQRRENLQPLSADRVVELMGSVFQWADTLSGDVTHYRQTLEQLIQRIDAESQQDSSRGAALSQLLDHLRGANHHLRQRMQSAENMLQGQASEIAQYVCRTRTDDLTGLANRRSFDDMMCKQLQCSDRQSQPLAVLLIEVDQVERLLVHHGQDGLDEILRQMACHLRETARAGDLVARYGEATFSVMMPDSIGAEAVLTSLRTIEMMKEWQPPFADCKPDITLSCGAAESKADDTAYTLMDRCQEALFASLRCNRDSTHLHNGRRCVPLLAANVAPQLVAQAAISRSPDAEQVPGQYPPEPLSQSGPLTIPENLQQVCSDLQQRYRQVSGKQSDT